ncbi:DUF3192 domain-containing protein [Bowmanella sp. JS7-9]|uniref:DUF3192 domain-containing protein n=1 Tax=Pseudobowmanella zhangzhouensis TaxID=1537679 RepID=A0ABW1XHA6_9ALTE|nr:DUF3192 domain-containing protein [Bowmanella sp. JS7-9]TBX25652.1 hypothetical protein TK45_02830 [Bowmanella sp. JS7-9]
MKKVIFKRIAIGLVAYAAIMLTVQYFYEEKTEDMVWQDRELFNKVKIEAMVSGTHRDKVIDLLGSPDISEAKRIGTDIYQVMFYRTQRKTSDGITTEDECTPLLFHNNQLIAKGDGSYQQYLAKQNSF